VRGISYSDPSGLRYEELEKAVKVLTPGEVANVLATMHTYKAGGDVVTLMKATQARATLQLDATLDVCIYLVRVAYPDDYRLRRAQVRTLITTIARLGSKVPGEPA
jgi:hypothetical protein